MSTTVTLTLNPCRSAILTSPRYYYSYNHKRNPNFNAFFTFSLSLSLSLSQSQRRSIVICKKPFPSRQTWLYGHMNRDPDTYSPDYELENGLALFGSDEELATKIPTQAQSVVEGSGSIRVAEFKPVPDVDYLQELLAIQQQGPRAIGFFGTRNMGFMHQELIEILSYAMVITKNHIYTSGASGTNAAVIRGALRAEKPELLTVILPQSLSKQSPESQELLSKVKNVIEKPHNDHLPLIEASRLCNMDIISHVQQVICFAFHDSRLLMETCQEAKNLRKIAHARRIFARDAMAQASKEPCKKEACDIQACLSRNNFLPQKCLKVIELLDSCCAKCDYNSTHCASLSGLLKRKPKR